MTVVLVELLPVCGAMAGVSLSVAPVLVWLLPWLGRRGARKRRVVRGVGDATAVGLGREWAEERDIVLGGQDQDRLSAASSCGTTLHLFPLGVRARSGARGRGGGRGIVLAAAVRSFGAEHDLEG